MRYIKPPPPNLPSTSQSTSIGGRFDDETDKSFQITMKENKKYNKTLFDEDKINTYRFFYFDESGKRITKLKLVRRINGLSIPPAWENIHISHNVKSKIQATGVDESGKTQYIYDQKFVEQREEIKDTKLLEMETIMNNIEKASMKYFSSVKKFPYDRDNVLMLMTLLMSEYGMRIGKEVYAKSNNTYGLSSLRHRHVKEVTINGKKSYKFDYISKRGKEVSYNLDPKYYDHINKLMSSNMGRSTKNTKLFRYINDSGNITNLYHNDLNMFVKQFGEGTKIGDDILTKDLRTIIANFYYTMFMLLFLKKSKGNFKHKDLITVSKSGIEYIANEVLNNTPAIAKKSYISSVLVDKFEDVNKWNKISNKLLEKSKLIDDDVTNPDAKHIKIVQDVIKVMLK